MTDRRQAQLRATVESLAKKILERTAEQAEDLGGETDEEDEYCRAVMSAIAEHGITYVSEAHVQAALHAARR